MTIQDFLLQLTEHCGLSADEVSVSLEEDGENLLVQLDLPEADSGLFIGYHGETLNSIQRILRLTFQREIERRIKLNINQYRQSREEKLVEMANNAAKKVLETGESHTFNYYLPPHERYVIHSTISDNPDYAELESVSSGEGKDRKLVVQLKR